MLDCFTTVIGVDREHLEQLKLVIKTWEKHKAEIFGNTLIVFADGKEMKQGLLKEKDIYDVIKIHPSHLLIRWDSEGSTNKERMLAGFVHVAARYVETKYYLKLDTDTVASFTSDDWLPLEWFRNDPVIVAHRWSYTKPPDQMIRLDEWVEYHKEKLPELNRFSALGLVPKPGSDCLPHKRIISWCGVFSTEFTKLCSEFCSRTVGSTVLPVSSQDGFLWYCAKRMRLPILEVNMKAKGWEHWHTMENLRMYCDYSLKR